MRGADNSRVTRDLGAYRVLGIVERADDRVVCAAVHRQSGVNRLVTVLLPGRVPGVVARRLVRQGQVLARIGHAALPAIFESGRLPSGGAFVVTDPIEGEPADQWLRRAGNLQTRAELAAAIVATVADACAQLHRDGVIHGDLRLGNLRLMPVDDGPRFALTLTGVETAALISARQACAPDARADVYAIGRLFFELLTGAPIAGEATPDLAAVTGLSIEMQRLLARLLAPHPQQRYQSAGEIVTAIELIVCRHRSRLPDLLRAPDGCAPLHAQREISPDLTALAPALDDDAAESRMAAAWTATRRLASTARDAINRRLFARVRRPAPPPSAAPTILVAEDDDDSRQALVELLQDHGYRVIAARHGLEAQEYLRKGQPAECMLMDLWMPEMDGWALAAEMKQGRLPAVPTIVMTAAEPHWGYPSPVVVRKPFDSRQLLALLQTTVPAPGVRAPITRRF
jgi:CheY-like chemotaxis protein